MPHPPPTPEPYPHRCPRRPRDRRNGIRRPATQEDLRNGSTATERTDRQIAPVKIGSCGQEYAPALASGQRSSLGDAPPQTTSAPRRARLAGRASVATARDARPQTISVLGRRAGGRTSMAQTFELEWSLGLRRLPYPTHGK
jgi:hypothetical protein